VVYQSLYLFSYPQIDTGAWFGDESWTMLTLREVARSGTARIPEAIGSSIAANNGFVNGVVWISGVLYGLPAIVFSNVLSPVETGRIITLLVSIALLLVLYRFVRRLGVGRTIARAALLALVASPVFYLSSHSARLDMITALAVVLALGMCLKLKNAGSARFFWTGFFVSISLAIYVHVPTLIALPWLASLWRYGATVRKWVIARAGAALGAVLLAVAYFVSVGNVALFGYGHNQYHSVVSALPILHPLSWQVQRINTIDRFSQAWSVEWPVLALVIVGIVLAAANRAQPGREIRWTLALACLVIFGWMFFEGPAVFYEIHAAPVFTILAAVLLAPSIRLKLPIALLSLALAGLAFYTQLGFGAAGETLSRNNEQAIRSLIAPLASAKEPIVLADQPAWNIVASSTGVRLMTTHLLLFGGEPRPLAEILRLHNVQYLVLYSTTHFQSPFRSIADSLYEQIGIRTGMLTDESKAYDESLWRVPDTVRLYKARFTP
jgi:hypothetical protein